MGSPAPTYEQRHAVLERDNYTCRWCNTPLPDNELAVHHIKSRGAWGSNEPSNLISLCAQCHQAAHMSLIPKAKLREMAK